MITKISPWIVLSGLTLVLAVALGHATMRVVQKEVSVSRALAGHVYVRGSDLPASGITVELCSANWKTVLASTKSDKKGYFSLEKPATGKLFYVRLSAPGMDIYYLRVRVKERAMPELTIHLSVAT